MRKPPPGSIVKQNPGREAGGAMSIFSPALIGCHEVTAMGKRIGKKWDLQGNGALWALCLCFLLGGAAGCLFAGAAGGESARVLSGYLTGYLTLAREGTVPRSLLALLWARLRELLAVAALGVTVVGVAGLPALFAARGFLFAFSVGCFCRVFGGPGLFPAFCLFGLPALLWAPALFLVGSQGLSWGVSALGRGEARGLAGGVFWIRAAVGLILAVLCVMLEYLTVPTLLKAASHVAL